MYHDFLADAGTLLSGLVEPGKEASLDPQTGNIVVPDAELLFSGKYQQAGRDLLILGDNGDKIVIPDDFAAKKRPNLQSPDGALLAADIVEILAGANRARIRADGRRERTRGDRPGRVVPACNMDAQRRPDHRSGRRPRLQAGPH